MAVRSQGQAGAPREPRRIWWARPGKLCALERPGGGGRSHRSERRAAEIAWLRARGVRLVVSTMATRHNLADYERVGLAWLHLPARRASDPAAAADLDALLALLRRELRRRGAVAVHGDSQTDFVAAACAAHVHEARGVAPAEALAAAAAAGLAVTPAACALLGVEPAAVAAAPGRGTAAAPRRAAGRRRARGRAGPATRP